MLLDEDPAALIHECITNFTITPDRDCLTRISDSLSTLHSARTLRLHDAESSLRQLSRQLGTLTQQHSLTVSSHNPTEHAASILALDAQKFKVAKEASDLEIEGERLELELAEMERQLELLEGRGVEEGEGRPAGEEHLILKLKLYRSLGIDVKADKSGKYRQAVVRNARKGVAHVIDFDSTFPRTFYTNLLWQTL